jgi:hypothetical protein
MRRPIKGFMDLHALARLDGYGSHALDDERSSGVIRIMYGVSEEDSRRRRYVNKGAVKKGVKR